MVNLLNIVERFSHQFRIKHRTGDVLHSLRGARRRTTIQNAHATATREKSRYQVLTDKAASACNERVRHGC
jgi:hypothetical protein